MVDSTTPTQALAEGSVNFGHPKCSTIAHECAVPSIMDSAGATDTGIYLYTMDANGAASLAKLLDTNHTPA